MGYHPRIETKKIATFQTTRSRNQEMWFVGNRKLEEAILGYAARYTTRYGVKLYALSIEGNHVHFPAHFPNANRAHFMRDFNSAIARTVPRYQPTYRGGRFWARRYSAEYLPGNEDIEEQFFYTVLQPVQDGIVDDISKYKGYNCFEDAISEAKRIYKVIRWKEYNDAKRWNDKVKIEDYTEEVILQYARLPGYEHLSKEEYMALMRRKLKERTLIVLQNRKVKKSASEDWQGTVKPGSRPRHSKKVNPDGHRPRVLSKDPERRAKGKAWYFSIYFAYRESSALYRSGQLDVKFPEGTYKPPLFTIAHNKPMIAL